MTYVLVDKWRVYWNGSERRNNDFHKKGRETKDQKNILEKVGPQC